MANHQFTNFEKWCPIPGWKKQYFASTFGRIMNLKNARIYGTPNEKNYASYRSITLRGSHRVLTTNIHQLIALTFLGPCPFGYEVNHKDAVKTNNNISNLEYVTYKEQIRHAFKMGLHHPLCGEANNLCKLTEKQARKIISLWRQGSSKYEIAASFGIHPDHAKRIGMGRSWKWLHLETVGLQSQ